MTLNADEGISVIMPTYNQSRFILGAIKSLLLQTYQGWELIIINDGSTDTTESVIFEIPYDERIHYYKTEVNCGLGAAINKGLSLANYGLIAYLPSDDIYFKEHLHTLFESLVGTEFIYSYSGVKFNSLTLLNQNYDGLCSGQIHGYPVQLVQMLHKKTDLRWMEREELVTDDLYTMYWEKLVELGEGTQTGAISCEWTNHPMQHHKLIDEQKGGGIFKYKKHYNIVSPLRYKSTQGNLIDEASHYSAFQNRFTSGARGALKILLVGELAYNPERICALEEKGHKLYGLWFDTPSCFTTIGPLPFGSVETIKYESWLEDIERIKPDIIYGLLNSQAVPFVHKILFENPNIPFVWHFKEGPTLSKQWGNWDMLMDLYLLSDGLIHTNIETKSWFDQFIPDSNRPWLILDGDLPKKDWFIKDRSQLLSEKDGEIHTLVPGRPMGLNPEHIAELAKRRIHFHFYGDVIQGAWREWALKAKKLGGKYFHLHQNCNQEDWVTEFSQYDAGWLHIFESKNYGELFKANWYDLNYPARIATLAVSGVPMILVDNSDHVVASQKLIIDNQIGICFDDFNELSSKLNDHQAMGIIRNNIWSLRNRFTFDYYVDDLVDFFKVVIKSRSSH